MSSPMSRRSRAAHKGHTTYTIPISLQTWLHQNTSPLLDFRGFESRSTSDPKQLGPRHKQIHRGFLKGLQNPKGVILTVSGAILGRRLEP